jgi:hypothetical protein
VPDRHPADNYLKSLIVRDRAVTDGDLQRMLEEASFLTADPTYLPLLRGTIPEEPPGFQPGNRGHRASVRFLRELKIYELFHPTEPMREAFEILSQPEKRRTVEQVLLARLDLKILANKVNAKHNWHLTADGMRIYQHYFWNVPAMTFDEWGRYLYNRSGLYDTYMSLLLASPMLAFYHLRLDQQIESKRMIQDVERIAHSTLLEVYERPGSHIDKAKSIKLLGTTLIQAHEALSTSDMALKEVMKQFEHWRMEHPQIQPPSVKQLTAGGGSFSGLGNSKDNVIELVTKPREEEPLDEV